MNIILLGPPGSGKGTQADVLSNDLGIAHISTGDILRRETEAQTELGKAVAATMQKGDLVDDETILTLTIKTLKSPETSKGFILDGVPRSLAQAEGLDKHNIEIHHIVDLLCSDEEIIKRITNRRVHPASGRVYNLASNPPKEPNKDDESGEDLVQRDDDKEATVLKRLQNYNEITSPLKDFYKKVAENDATVKYHQIESNQAPQQVTQDIKRALGCA